MIAKTIIRGWLIFFSIVFVFAGFLWVKEGGLHEPRPIETASLEDETVVLTDEMQNQTQELVEEPEPAPTDIPQPTQEVQPEDPAPKQPLEETSRQEEAQPEPQQPSEETTPQEHSEPKEQLKFETVLPPVTLPIDVQASKPNPCKLLGQKSAIAEQQFDETNNLHVLKVVANTTLTVPFPAEIMKVYETVNSGHTLELKSRDGNRALRLGGFSKTLQTMRFTQPLECGDSLPVLAEGQKLYVQLRDIKGQEWWQGEIIDPAELFN